MAVTGLLVLISSQFRDRDFSAGPDLLSGFPGATFMGWRPRPASLFRIKYPYDWADDELYDFDWGALQNQTDRFGKIDFDAIPY